MRLLTLFFLILYVKSFSQVDEKKGTIVIHKNCEKYLGNDTLFSKVDKMPSFPNGEEALFKFIRKQFIYPEMDELNSSSGMSVVQYVVQKNGLITDIQLFKTSGSNLFDKEAIRVVKLMPNWIPGTCNGENIATVHYLPINFRLK